MSPREHDRFGSTLRIRVRVPGVASATDAVCRNMSFSGMFVELESPPDRGTRVSVEILQKSATPLEAEGIVAWTRPKMPDPKFPPGMGIRFVDPSEEVRRFLEAYLSTDKSSDPPKDSSGTASSR
ncbi:MAG: PilZ domain-containing protein [Planctomycetota bacterium]|nr:PilZ domain-containing protein [Planctomycetota bacterium]